MSIPIARMIVKTKTAMTMKMRRDMITVEFIILTMDTTTFDNGCINCKFDDDKKKCRNDEISQLWVKKHILNHLSCLLANNFLQVKDTFSRRCFHLKIIITRIYSNFQLYRYCIDHFNRVTGVQIQQFSFCRGA